MERRIKMDSISLRNKTLTLIMLLFCTCGSLFGQQKKETPVKTKVKPGNILSVYQETHYFVGSRDTHELYTGFGISYTRYGDTNLGLSLGLSFAFLGDKDLASLEDDLFLGFGVLSFRIGRYYKFKNFGFTIQPVTTFSLACLFQTGVYANFDFFISKSFVINFGGSVQWGLALRAKTGEERAQAMEENPLFGGFEPTWESLIMAALNVGVSFAF